MTKTEKLQLFRQKLQMLDELSGNTLKAMRHKLQRLYQTICQGGSKGLVKHRTGNQLIDIGNLSWYNFWRWLDKLDTLIIFRGKIYQAKVCRVRSKGEKQIANFLTEHGISFKYEPRLKLGKQKIRPDFYLPRYEVYIEFWGPINDDANYQLAACLKQALYRFYRIKVISVYPCNLKDLRSYFVKTFPEIIGQPFPLDRR